MTLVSVVVPVYNVSMYLDGLFKNLLHQTFRDIEIICVDDGSSDNSAEIIKRIEQKDSRVKYFYQPNQGGGAARNTGIQKAKGTYLICLDSDDYYEKNLIELLYNKAESTNSDITFCTYKLKNMQTGRITRNKGINYKLLPGKDVFSVRDVKNIFAVTNPAPFNKLYKTDFIKNNDLRYSLTKSSNDVAFTMLALASARKIAFVNKELIIYRYLSPVSGSAKREKYSYQCVTAFEDLYRGLKSRNLHNELKDVYIEKVINSIIYEMNFPVGELFFSSIKDFWAKEPFNTVDTKILNNMFNEKKLYIQYLEYLFLNILTLGTQSEIKNKLNYKKLSLKNMKLLMKLLK